MGNKIGSIQNTSSTALMRCWDFWKQRTQAFWGPPVHVGSTVTLIFYIAGVPTPFPKSITWISLTLVYWAPGGHQGFFRPCFFYSLVSTGRSPKAWGQSPNTHHSSFTYMFASRRTVLQKNTFAHAYINHWAPLLQTPYPPFIIPLHFVYYPFLPWTFLFPFHVI